MKVSVKTFPSSVTMSRIYVRGGEYEGRGCLRATVAMLGTKVSISEKFLLYSM